MARTESQQDANRRRTPVVVGIGRVLVYVVAGVAAAVAVWSLISGADRDLWSDTAGFIQALVAVAFTS